MALPPLGRHRQGQIYEKVIFKSFLSTPILGENKMHNYDGHEDCRNFYPMVRGSGLSFESIWPCSKNVLDLK